MRHSRRPRRWRGLRRASNVTSFAARLTGLIEPGGSPAGYHFLYGLTSSYGSILPQPDAIADAGGLRSVSQLLTGLQPGTTYHLALAATNLGGSVSVGPDEAFTTRPLVAPAVSAGGAEAVGETSVTLTGSVDPEGIATTYRFEYGQSAAYGSSWPLVQVLAGNGSTAQSVAIDVPNLQPGITYHYRLVASNEDGTSYGADESFTTPTFPSSVLVAPVTALLIGPPDIAVPNAGTETKKLTNTQKLARALKACKKKPKSRRASCEKTARKKYAPGKKKK
jgi:hypothetical protein